MVHHGFILSADPAVRHELIHPFIDVQPHGPRRYVETSLNKAVRNVVEVGNGYVTVTVHPSEIHGSLRNWLERMSDVEGYYFVGLPPAERRAACSIYVDDLDALNSPDWFTRPIPIRLVPREARVDTLLTLIAEVR